MNKLKKINFLMFALFCGACLREDVILLSSTCEPNAACVVTSTNETIIVTEQQAAGLNVTPGRISCPEDREPQCIEYLKPEPDCDISSTVKNPSFQSTLPNSNCNATAAFVLAVDVSGSMGDRYRDVKDAICGLVGTQPFDSSEFAVVAFGATSDQTDGVIVYQGFSDLETTCHTLQSKPYSEGEEYQLRGILKAGALAWPNGMDRHIIVFSDEHQHFFTDHDGSDVVDKCQGNFDLGIFATGQTVVEWNPYIQVCDGFTAPIDSGFKSITDKLVARFGTDCFNK